MTIGTFHSQRELGESAARAAVEILNRAIIERGRASLVAATGKSQIDFLDALALKPIDWAKVAVYQLDEYLGLPAGHPASLGEFLDAHLIRRVRPGDAHLLRDGVPKLPAIDVAFVGVGENGHLAFNDPPADFETEDAYIEVALDPRCRRQQVDEGWFAAIDEVPARAISMSIRQIMKSREILCVVPERRKAEAVRDCFQGAISALHPASILQAHLHATIFLDRESASLLRAS